MAGLERALHGDHINKRLRHGLLGYISVLRNVSSIQACKVPKNNIFGAEPVLNVRHGSFWNKYNLIPGANIGPRT